MRACERGSEVVQFVIVVPLMLVVLFSIMQLAGMTLAASQVSSEITRACCQFDAAGFQLAGDKEGFIKKGILGASTQLDPDRLFVEHVSLTSGQTNQEQAVCGGGVIAERARVVAASYNIRYMLPALAELPGLTRRTLERRVQCSFVDGRTIEIVQEAS